MSKQSAEPVHRCRECKRKTPDDLWCPLHNRCVHCCQIAEDDEEQEDKPDA